MKRRYFEVVCDGRIIGRYRTSQAAEAHMDAIRVCAHSAFVVIALYPASARCGWLER